MDFRELDQTTYDSRLRAVIVGTEGLHAQAQDVGDGRATIGWGYTFNRNNNVDIWTRSGIALNPEQFETLRRVDQEPTIAGKTRIGLTFTRELNEAESDSLFRASVQEYEGPAIAADMPLSDERIAMVSVTYNRGVGAMRNHAINDAISQGDRAEAWYEMRYNCWGSREDMEGGLRKRRFAESEILGLYDDRTNVSVVEAASVYAMYQSHRSEIERVEQGFGVTIDGTEASPNRIVQANRDYPDIVGVYGPVRTISDSLQPAATVLIEHLQTQYPEHADEFDQARFNAGQIDLERFPVHAISQEMQGEGQDSLHPATIRGSDGTSDARQGANQPQPVPFSEPFLNRYYAAVTAGDRELARRITIEFAQSSQGEAFMQRGEELLAQQQASNRQSQDQQTGQGLQDVPVRS